MPTASDVAKVDVGGLRRNRVCGLIEVDFAARRLRLEFIDYYGGDEVNELEPSPEFWERAARVTWPIRD